MGFRTSRATSNCYFHHFGRSLKALEDGYEKVLRGYSETVTIKANMASLYTSSVLRKQSSPHDAVHSSQYDISFAGKPGDYQGPCGNKVRLAVLCMQPNACELFPPKISESRAIQKDTQSLAFKIIHHISNHQINILVIPNWRQLRSTDMTTRHSHGTSRSLPVASAGNAHSQPLRSPLAQRRDKSQLSCNLCKRRKWVLYITVTALHVG